MFYSKDDNRIQDTIPLRLYTDVGIKCSIVRLITRLRTQFHSDFTQKWETESEEK